MLSAILVAVAALDGGLAVPESIVFTGAPALPQATADALSPYLEARLAIFGGWHARRHELLVVTRFGETWQLHQVLTPMGARTQRTFAKDGTWSEAVWLSNDTILSSRAEGGNEQDQFFRLEPSGASTRMTSGEGRNTTLVVSNDEKLAAWGSTQRNGADVDVWVGSPSGVPAPRLLVERSGGGWQVLSFSPDGSQVLIGNYKSISDVQLFLVDVKTAALKPVGAVVDGTPELISERVCFLPDGKSLVFVSDRDSNFARLVQLSILDGKRTELTKGAEVDFFDVTRDGKRVVYSLNDRGQSTLRQLELPTKKDVALPRAPRGLIGSLELHSDGTVVALSVSSNSGGTDVYTYDLRAQTSTRWTASETGGLDGSKWVEPTVVEWRSTDGLLISGLLYTPPARFKGPRPVVVSMHGGPEGQTRPEGLLEWNFMIEELGIALLFPNVRGSTGFGKQFLAADNGRNRELAVQDMLSALEWIATRSDLDPKRIAVAGGSYGGFMSLSAAYRASSKVRAVIDVVGPSNLVTFLENTSDYRKDLRRVEYGDERDPAMRAYLESIAPLRNAQHIKTPLLVIQGAQDPRVPQSEADQLVTRVRKEGVPVWYLLAKDEGHGFAKRSNVDFKMAAEVEFLRRYLLGP